ncbi:MAG: Ni/Fe-hydrogenase, b-type cytochrome subunit [Deltaproteobacteria bacterium]|nr:Ni/Fe-hydrogenase, b-type cytochrome subunit [Deltaproteobacteria bacterium]
MSIEAEHIHMERVYVWEVPVRLSHWLIVVSLLVLSVTGLYIGNPFIPVSGEATQHFVMGTMKSIHFVAAMVFTLSVVWRIVWMFVGNPYARWSEFLPVSKRRLVGIWNTIAFYTFLHRDSPAFVGHNPLAGAVYTVVFGLFAVMIATGLALSAANAHMNSMLSGFQFLIPLCGGLQMARFIHHVGMWLLLGFAAHHFWSAFLVGTVERSSLLDSIFSGYKVLTPDVARRARKHIEED